jgi:hypothetical protein
LLVGGTVAAAIVATVIMLRMCGMRVQLIWIAGDVAGDANMTTPPRSGVRCLAKGVIG